MIARHASFCTYFYIFVHTQVSYYVSLLHSISKLSHPYNTRAYSMKKMENIKQENRELHEEVTALRAGMANLTTLVESLVVAQNKPPPPPPPPHVAQPQQKTITFEVPSIPIFVTPINASQNHMPHGYPWGMPENFMPEGYSYDAQVSPFAQIGVLTAPPVVHVAPAARNEIHYTVPPSMNVLAIY